MSIKKSFENVNGVEVFYWKITHLEPVKEQEVLSTNGENEIRQEGTIITLSGWINESAKQNNKSVLETKYIYIPETIEGGGRPTFYEKIMDLPDWENSETC